MKKILIVLGWTCIFASACSKSEKESTSSSAMNFTINGASDVTYKFEKAYMPLTLTLVSGPQEKLDLSVAGLPSGMKGTFASASGTPTFSTTLEFTHSGKVSAGSYPVQVVATTTAGKVKTVGMNLIIVDDCGKPLVGAYKGEEYTDGRLTGTLSTVSASIKADNPNRIYLSTDPSGDPFILDLNCSEQTITIAPYGAYAYTGTFTTSPAYIEIRETSSSGTRVLKFTRP